MHYSVCDAAKAAFSGVSARLRVALSKAAAAPGEQKSGVNRDSQKVGVGVEEVDRGYSVLRLARAQAAADSR